MIERERLTVHGVVQGVGFRPFVWRLAQRFHLYGEVRNDTHGVQIDIQGERHDLDAFQATLTQQPPPLARIDTVRCHMVAPNLQWREFRIAPSTDNVAAQSRIPVDSAPCEACIAELFTAGGRRWRHPFICCTDCGPRFTLTRRTPYDRANTSMAGFALCARCAAEYANPADRRFHAETIACPDCGPTLRFARLDGTASRNEHVASPSSLSEKTDADAIAQAWAAIVRGEIVAVQGLGGFQLICDATNPAAVARLRERKRRPARPFALLAPNLISAAQWVNVEVGGASNGALLASPARPVVVLPQREGITLDGVAPGLNRLGVMLPSTPVQYLLFHQALGQPAGTQWLDEVQPVLFVATSANLSGEPLLGDSTEARRVLTGIADAILDHDREIVVRCDDSVVLAATPSLPAVMLRRARGYAPEPLPLPVRLDGSPVLAFGAQMKNTVTLTGKKGADVSPYLGDLRSPRVCDMLDVTVERLIQHRHAIPSAIACDKQPDLYSTRIAEALAERWSVPLLRVQHHHAHIAAVLAENGHAGPALGLALDGFGYGDDGHAWGGELLRVEHGRAQRLGHLTPLPLPGGDVAARAPWRMAAALQHTLEPDARRPLPGVEASPLALLYQQLGRGFNCPTTTSLGRWFDAIAGLAGICPIQSYEGEAAMKLEALVRPDVFDTHINASSANGSGWSINCTDGWNLNLLPLARELAALRDPAEIASRWHATLAAALADWIHHTMNATGIDVIALGGGCCANLTLLHGLRKALKIRGNAHSRYTLLRSRRLPPGDDAISYGQAWVAIQQ